MTWIDALLFLLVLIVSIPLGFIFVIGAEADRRIYEDRHGRKQ